MAEQKVSFFDVLESLCELMEKHAAGDLMKLPNPNPIGRAEQAAAWVLEHLELIDETGHVDTPAMYRRDWSVDELGDVAWKDPGEPKVTGGTLAAALRAMYPAPTVKKITFGED